MDRDSQEGGGLDPVALAAQRNSRFTSPLVVNSAYQRKPLFSRPPPVQNNMPSETQDLLHFLPVTSNTAPDPNQSSPPVTRIPRPPQTRPPPPRRPFTLSDAYRMAEEEEAAQGSPSPAPRSWRSRRESVELPRALDQSASDSQHPRRRARNSVEAGPGDTTGSANGHGSRSRRGDVSENDFDEKLCQHALSRTSSEEPVQRGDTSSKTAARIAETGKEPVPKSGRGAIGTNNKLPLTSKAAAKSGWLSRRVSDKKEHGSNEKLPSHEQAEITKGAAGEPLSLSTDPVLLPNSNPNSPGFRSPEKSFAWQAEADFTASDLQVSNSPPVVAGRSNTRIDEIRVLEAEVNGELSEDADPRPRNTRIDEIRALEVEAASKFPDEPLETDEDTDSIRAKNSGDGEDKLLRTRHVGRANAKSDDLRAREIESLTKRALATARLDEIRERNTDSTSRSSSPDIVRKSSKEPLRNFSPASDRGRPGAGREHVAKAISHDVRKAVKVVTGDDGGRPVLDVEAGKHQESSDGSKPTRGSSHSRDDSRDILRRLALATSTSPAPELRIPKLDTNFIARDGEGRVTTKQKKADCAKGDVKPTVGFAGFKRDSSVDSSSDKRSNFAHSDSDPTERIEGEMKLFAPLENHSERGSLRAPSPAPEQGETTDDTPRPTKPDPLTQPTPRVTGAFIETPTSVKIERFEESPAAGSSNTGTLGSGVDREGAGYSASTGDGGLDVQLRGRRVNVSPRQPEHAFSATDDRVLGRQSSALNVHRRAKSVPRTRSALVNSARPPTVKDDLLEIQKANQFEDSTLDDIADLTEFLDQRPRKLEALESRRPGYDGAAREFLGMEKELAAYDRMSKTLKTGILGIRTAKKGIERLEDKVSHADTKDIVHGAHGNSSIMCPVCHGHLATEVSGSYIRLPLPRLWSRDPRFRFTLSGLLVFLLSLWYIAESSVCFLYCKPLYCYPGKPCDWSPDDPLWGYSIPVKLDQWVTGGRAREFANRVGPDVADWLADVWDVAIGSDITQVDTSYYTWDQKRQHRRRLLKKGLVRPFVERPEDKAKFGAWRAARLLMERVDSAREMGYSVDEDESIAGDERVLGS
ncbi:hypothetical protein B0T24DRAFT_606689 [Lasiosphaeria ovina]|uniref:Uncharacterized protein n=1 Tax=Lasiosphaeria ovina TaxID=92902 RepID=A0AAE0TY93_9PEZI|nr:hypothetical protein B0T24DRAFT_606689 [Lasiosphaeria ovina]